MLTPTVSSLRNQSVSRHLVLYCNYQSAWAAPKLLFIHGSTASVLQLADLGEINPLPFQMVFTPLVVCQDGNWWSPHVVKLVGINPHHAHNNGWSIGWLVNCDQILNIVDPQICIASTDQYHENFDFWPVFPRYYIIWGSEWIVLWNSYLHLHLMYYISK